ncbi:Rieske 2Fe-2S domain-containing protein [Microbacterium sp. STN6]|uniref:Rieske 2Fe-2S domain-containing protein n=1 Tax=Microbacterium sp. STN6 TaxID=2995588 RepID=UPI002260AF4A|nr:Rieske 2Fe-2S domain-containing protein [Microbacterium sp. STN6]MCX7521923.1 Rieske 2Fe-2S domain-containing protein [Microbacterium sp. STN6]
MKRLPLLKMIDRVENARALDPLAQGIRAAIDKLVRPQALRDVLNGVPIGHPLHPLLVQVPIGAWTSAAALDAVGGNRRAARLLVALGIAGALPSALAGYTDFSRLHQQQMRVGVVHSSANVVATILYTASLVQRRRGREGSGRLLGFAGYTAVMVGGYLGGHLSYRQAAGVNHTEDVPHRVSPDWQPLAELEELTEGKLESRMLGEVPLVVLRRGEKVSVLADVCSHLSGPLHEGTLTDGASACVVCPWHGSTFSLETGEVVHGPATAAQPRFDARVRDGRVEVCLPGAG